MDPLSGDDLAVWQACKSVGDTVLRRVEADLVAATGLSGADWGVISRLQDLGGGRLGQQALAQSMGLTKGALSRQLTRMTVRGLVERDRTATGVTVVLTHQGLEMLDRARPVHASAVRRHLLDKLPPHERAALLSIAARLTP